MLEAATFVFLFVTNIQHSEVHGLTELECTSMVAQAPVAVAMYARLSGGVPMQLVFAGCEREER